MNEIIGLVDLSDWKTKKKIIKELKSKGISINEREWRRLVEKFNNLYINDEIPTLIAHSNKGYKLTTDKDEINQTAEELIKKAITMFKRGCGIKKALNLKDNLKLDFEEAIYG